MKRVTNKDLADTLGDIREDLGSIKAQLEAHTKAFASHVQSDEAMAADIKRLELKAANSAGVAKGRSGVVAFVGSTVGAGLTLLANHFWK